MNDFTKEELHIIHYWGLDRLENVGLPFFTEEGHLNLYKKIQAMIDNYCDHESAENIGGWCWKCTSCGMKWGDETQ